MSVSLAFLKLVFKLLLDDDSKEVIARYHPKNQFKTGKSEAYLDIFAEGKEMIDMIFVTFVYIETCRKDNERSARYRGGG